MIIRTQRGFTLIEFVMVILIMGIIFVGLSKLYSQTLYSMLTEQSVTDALWQGRLGMERMIKEIRATRSASDISANTSNNYTFTDISGTSIAYTVSGSTLTRNGVVLADGINSLAFSYFDKNGATTGVATNIAYIQISLNVTRNNTNYTLTSGVYLRDLSS